MVGLIYINLKQHKLIIIIIIIIIINTFSETLQWVISLIIMMTAPACETD
jgi:hypothetical protein